MAITREQFFDDDLMSQFPELANTSRDLAEQLYPSGGLSAEEKMRLSELTNRARRLSPMEAPPMQGSTRIPGNVFSVDHSPVYNALQQGLVNTINSIRQKRMLKTDDEKAAEAEKSLAAAKEITGDDEESNLIRKGLEEEAKRLMSEAQSPTAQIESLTQKKEEGQRTEELQDEVMGRLFPDLVGKAVDARQRLSEEGVRHANTIEEIKERGAQQIAAIKTRIQEETGGNTKSPEYAVGVITGFLGQTDPMSKSITSTIEGLQQQRSLVDDPSEIDKQIKDLEKKRAELQSWRSDAYKALSEGNLYDSDLIDRLDTIMGVEGPKAPAPNRAGSFIEGSNQSMFNFRGVFE